MTTAKPKLLDIFCGAGGASTGYYRAGFDVTGVDIEPQKHYPFRFIQADAIDYVAAHGHEYDAIAASPPCQIHSQMTPDKLKHEDWIPITRFMLESIGVPYIIENVGGARKALRNPVILCGSQFGLKVYRHRFFESNVLLLMPAHYPHRDNTPTGGRGLSDKGFVTVTGGGHTLRRRDGTYNKVLQNGFVSVAGRGGNGVGFTEYARFAMGIDWMTGAELSQAIPPAFTYFLGKQLMAYVLDKQPEIKLWEWAA